MRRITFFFFFAERMFQCLNKMLRMLLHFSFRPFANINLLLFNRPGDPVIFQASVNPDSLGVNVRKDVIKIPVISNIAVKLPIVGVSRVSVN